MSQPVPLHSFDVNDRADIHQCPLYSIVVGVKRVPELE